MAAVFMGRPDAVGRYCAEREVAFRCFADPDRTAYRAFRLEVGGPTKWLLSPAVLGKGAKLLGRGRMVRPPGAGQDIRQLQGMFVVGPDGRIVFAHYGKNASDNAPIDSVIAALGAG